MRTEIDGNGSASSALDPEEERRAMSGHDEELDRLRAAVNCATVLERLAPGWTLDKTESTRRALKYRGGPGEILIINHDGQGWWDPQKMPSEAGARGDAFSLVQRLDPALNFGQVRKTLRNLVGIAPAFPAFTRQRPRTAPAQLPTLRWQRRRRLHRRSPTWRYLTDERRLPSCVLATAADFDAVREGPYGSAWFAHRDNGGRVTGIEMRGPHYRGFTADGTKTLFRLPGSRGSITRLVVAEAPIDALSVAALERIRADTLYAATGGGMGPGTIAALNELLAELAPHPTALMVIATDADRAGERYATQLTAMATDARVPVERAQPGDGLNDWNDVVKARAGRGAR
jgi:Protein of unknown function (DUF3991)/Toprim-like